MVNRTSHIIKVILVFLVIMAFGVAGLMIIEGWPFLDALYMVGITLSTIGYREVHELSTPGTIFLIGFIILGVGSFLYVVSTTAEFIVEGHLKGVLGRKKMTKKIHELNGHYIICGFGRVGQRVAQELKKDGAEFVVIDVNRDAINACVQLGYLYIDGSASNDDVLKEAGIMTAKGLVSAIDSDAENVYVTLSAKTLRSDLYVVARASCDEAEYKLLKAHADRVLSPYTIGGRRLASLLMRPNVVEFLDVVMHAGQERLLMEEITVLGESTLSGLTIGDVKSRCPGGVNILAIKKNGDPKVTASPAGKTVISTGDMLITLGTREQLKELEEMI